MLSTIASISFATAENLARLQAPINRACRWGLYAQKEAATFQFQSFCDKADETLFSKIYSTTSHVLHSFFTPQPQEHTYDLRPRCHSFELRKSSNSLQINFLYRMLYKLARVDN